MGSLLLEGGIVSEFWMNHCQLLQGGGGESTLSEASYISSNISNSQSSCSFDTIDHYSYMLEGVIPYNANQYLDTISYHRLPSLLEQPIRFTNDNPLSNTTINYKLDDNASHISEINNPSDSHGTKDNSILSLSSTSNQLCDQSHQIDFSQILKTDYPMLYEHPCSPFVPDDDHNSSYKQPLFDGCKAAHARECHAKCLAQQSSEALVTPSNGAYCPYISNHTSHSSHVPPSIISSNASPNISFASCLSTLADAASTAQDDCHLDVHPEMIPCLMGLNRPPRSLINKNMKGRDIGIKNENKANGRAAVKYHLEVDKMVKKKRKRTRSRKNSEELESQRMTHIAVERNRRRQMNHHLNALRSLMPSSYIQRGDQASIVGGAIRFVEELEQVVQSLRLQKQIKGRKGPAPLSHLAADKPSLGAPISEESYACSQSSLVNVEVNIISLSSILVKVLVPKRPHQLLDTLHALNLLSFKVLRLHITTLDISILYTFNLEMESEFQLQTPIELAESIQHIFKTSNENQPL